MQAPPQKAKSQRQRPLKASPSVASSSNPVNNNTNKSPSASQKPQGTVQQPGQASSSNTGTKRHHRNQWRKAKPTVKRLEEVATEPTSASVKGYCRICLKNYDPSTDHFNSTSHRHYASYCVDCNVYCGTPELLSGHQAKRHTPAPAPAPQQPPPVAAKNNSKPTQRELSYCKECKVYCGTVAGLEKHRLKRHLPAAPAQSHQVTRVPVAASSSVNQAVSFACQTCDRSFNSERAKQSHDNSVGHRTKLREITSATDANLRIGIEFDNVLKWNSANFTLSKAPWTHGKIRVHCSSSSPVSVTNLFVVPAMDSINLQRFIPFTLAPCGEVTMNIDVVTKYISTLPFRIVIRFENREKICPVSVDVTDDVVQSLAPVKQFSRPSAPKDILADSDIVIHDGEKPDASSYAFFPELFSPFLVADSLGGWVFIFGLSRLPVQTPSLVSRYLPFFSSKPAQFANSLAPRLSKRDLDLLLHLTTNCSVQSAATHLQTRFHGLQLMEKLIWLENIQMQENIKFYNIEHARMTESGKYLCLGVPGLAEKRPSVLVGDSVYARGYLSDGSLSKHTWRGYVHHVQRDAVLLRFHADFHSNFIEGSSFHVQFGLNDLPTRRCHTAVWTLDQTRSFRQMMNPRPDAEMNPFDIQKVRVWYNNKLNSRQRQAVEFIAYGPTTGAPYILFGPAGTGKTTTLVECIMQTYLSDKNARILAVAPSNSAADHIVEKLAVHLDPMHMFRLNALHRSSASVPEVVKKYSLERSTDWFVLPNMTTLRQYSVIVSTCISAGLLYAVDIGKTHFTHVIVDEASQATEPETLVALAGIAAFDCTFVLSGDPKQLGPIIHSLVARRLKYDQSFMERLFLNHLYLKHGHFEQFGGYNPLYITKLVDNYRSHPALLQVPSALFYESELVHCADPARTHSFLGWEELPNYEVPLIFHSVTYKDEREANSPSYFNAGEAAVVVDYVTRLFQYKRSAIQPKDIGIITPYHKQVQKIRQALERKGLYNPRAGADQIKVASVEEFQGQERRVIIISTVRSSPDLVMSHDAKFNLGFLRNAKRLNVSITRAQALMIVVGSPSVLYHDPNWKYLIDHCIQKKAYRGEPPPAADPSKYFGQLEDNLKSKEENMDGAIDRSIHRDD